MIIFAVLSPGDNSGLLTALGATFPDNFLRVGPGQYLVAAKGVTAVDVSNTLGISDGKNGTGVVLSTTSYFGRAENTVWEWLSLKVSTP